MRVLAMTSLYSNPFQPNLAPFNRQQFAALAALHPLAVIAPISWTVEAMARLRGSSWLPAGRHVERDGISIDHPRYLFPPKILRHSYGNWYRRSVAPAFQRAVESFKPDVVLAAWAYPDGWAAIKLAHDANLPVVLKVHGSDILTLKKSSNRFRQTAEALREADGVIAVSQDLAEKVAEMGANRQNIKVIYNGINSELFKPGSRPQARANLGLQQDIPVILYIGNLYPVKGPDILVQACAILLRQNRPFRCYMIGAGPLQSKLQRQIAALGLGDRVQLAGPKPHHELPTWFQAANVLTLPSHSEGVANVLLEASACGTPYVASRVGGIPEIAHLGAGWLVPPGDAPALAEAIQKTIETPPTAYGRRAARSHQDSAAELAGELAKVCGLKTSAHRPTAPTPLH
jgi:glycosyltransferase involved in cell wall biosynthesis